MHLQRIVMHEVSHVNGIGNRSRKLGIKRIARKLKLERPALSAGMSGMRGH